MTDPAITIEAIRAARAALGSHIVTTPTLDWQADELRERLGSDTRINLKLELFQRTGTFKPRGALTVMLALDAAQRARGVTAVSAGNHAIATAYAARTLGISARVVMLPTANPARIERCRRLGAEVEIAADGAAAFERARQIEAEEGRAFVHPFEGPRTALGTATIGLEWASQTEPLDVLICPIGGGGLCAGLATAIRLLMPGCRVFGVEPEGADNMRRSFAEGVPAANATIATIADSLGPPYSLPYSFGLCREAVEEIVLVSDDALRAGMDLLFREARLAVEPAAAAATAALMGPLAERVRGKRVGVIVCGANIDIAGFAAHVEAGQHITGLQ
ncbi:pyridoxal-phosphate dependent enzyme [Sphingosinicella microcystinivorans]|uniref:pyridoxal-phosphate dependent enzyme n=1 Tax=Sphingosinicella microcystinivorans TaxID=335406 RepID=UPI0022F3FAD3|nr:pyridoxal-phosphate dependent enzyme [Sphingosinicella microcystinivorans]WBX84294.1 pyridoxal-phosphate dependent enzyme [Sphingosinicella microcystinivorans]